MSYIRYLYRLTIYSINSTGIQRHSIIDLYLLSKVMYTSSIKGFTIEISLNYVLIYGNGAIQNIYIEYTR